MKEITQIALYYRKDRDADLEVEEVPPVSQSVKEIKLQLAKMIAALPQTGTYYVVIGAKRNDGKIGFRTIIPKTVL